jgi:hypothetical protein
MQEIYILVFNKHIENMSTRDFLRQTQRELLTDNFRVKKIMQFTPFEMMLFYKAIFERNVSYFKEEF